MVRGLRGFLRSLLARALLLSVVDVGGTGRDETAGSAGE